MVIAEAPFVGEEIDIFTDCIVKVLKKEQFLPSLKFVPKSPKIYSRNLEEQS